MRVVSLSSLVFLATVVPGVGAQRGRGRPPEIQERVACYFLEAKLPAIEGVVESKERLASLPMVKDAKEKQQLAFLYLFDSSVDEPKRENFDRIIFGNDQVGIGLRCFRCARVDLAGDADAQAKFGRRLPLFVAFDKHGKWVGEVSLPGYKAALQSLFGLLEKAANGHVMPTHDDFVKRYTEFIREMGVLAGRRNTLAQRRQRADDKKKKELDAEAEELDELEQKLLANEKALLEKAKLPPRDPEAKRFGSQENGGRGR